MKPPYSGRKKPKGVLVESGSLGLLPKSADTLQPRLNMEEKSIANKYCEGKMKRILKRRLKDVKPLKRKLREVANAMYGRRLHRLRATLRGRMPAHKEGSLLAEDKMGYGFVTSSLDFSQAVGHGCGRGAFAILSERLPKTRLETRTKESTNYVSLRVENP